MQPLQRDDQLPERVTRRRILRVGILGSLGITAGGGAFSTFVEFLRSDVRPVVRVPRPRRQRGELRAQPMLHEFDGVRAGVFVGEYPQTALTKARNVYSPGVLDGMEAGLVALSARCPHLKNKVDWCATSQWFECPSHGSQFNAVGEKKGGPAPRGMTLLRVVPRVDGKFDLFVHEETPGAAIGTDTTGQGVEGPHCV
jgi:Rieske Fe-S protein